MEVKRGLTIREQWSVQSFSIFGNVLIANQNKQLPNHVKVLLKRFYLNGQG